MFRIVLVEPQIPPNTGNVIRLAANTGCSLHLIEPLGFSMDDKQLQRAGLDYHEYAVVQRHATWQAFINTEAPALSRCFAFSTRAASSLGAMHWKPGDTFIFGNETAGLPTCAAGRLCALAARAPAHARWAAQPEPQQRRGGGGV